MPAASVQATGWGATEASQTTHWFPRKTTTASSALQRVAVTSCTTVTSLTPIPGTGLAWGPYTHTGCDGQTSAARGAVRQPRQRLISQKRARGTGTTRTAPLVPGALTRSAEPGWLRVPGCGLGVCGCLLSGSGRPRSCDSSTAQRAPAPLPNRGLRQGGEPRDSRRLREEAGAGGSGDSPAAGTGLGRQELCLQEHGDLRAAPGCSCRPRGELWPGPCRLTRPCPPSAARRSAGCTPTSPRGRSGRWLHLERGERRGVEDGDRGWGPTGGGQRAAHGDRAQPPAPGSGPVSPPPPTSRPAPSPPPAAPSPPPPCPRSRPPARSRPGAALTEPALQLPGAVHGRSAPPRRRAGRKRRGPGGSPAQRPARPRPLPVLPTQCRAPRGRGCSGHSVLAPGAVPVGAGDPAPSQPAHPAVPTRNAQGQSHSCSQLPGGLAFTRLPQPYRPQTPPRAPLV